MAIQTHLGMIRRPALRSGAALSDRGEFIDGVGGFRLGYAQLDGINTDMKNTKTSSAGTATRLADSLNQVLADSYALMALTHLAHWNVEGAGFFALHTAFQTQYEELFTAIDEIAERVRALDAYAIGGLGKFAQTAAMKEFASPLAQEEYVKRLIVANEKLLADAAAARDLAGQANDAESQDLMIGRITLHQKTVWMLKSFLKDS